MRLWRRLVLLILFAVRGSGRWVSPERWRRMRLLSLPCPSLSWLGIFDAAHSNVGHAPKRIIVLPIVFSALVLFVALIKFRDGQPARLVQLIQGPGTVAPSVVTGPVQIVNSWDYDPTRPAADAAQPEDVFGRLIVVTGA